MKVKIYYANVSCLKDEELFARLYSAVTRERREKVDRLRFDKDKRLSLGAGALLCLALSERGLPSEAELSYGENGKPYVADQDIFYFSLSHSSELAMCAVSDVEIGCDVERIGKYDGRIAGRFFSKAENDYIESFPDMAGRDAAFFRVWTRKESFLKATGLGFSVSSSSFTAISKKSEKLRQSVSVGAWCVYDAACDLRYSASFCTNGKVRADDVETVKIDLRRDVC